MFHNLNAFEKMTKQQLALMYFPDASPRVAVNRLARWIAHCRGLAEALAALGYHKRNRHFTPREVQVVFRFLGEPEAVKSEELL